MESQNKEPDTENVVYIDEYPELAKRVWLRRLDAQRKLGTAVLKPSLLVLPTEYTPDDAS